MNAVTICGKEYQLCMTVEAFDQITQACGGIDKLGSYLDGDGDIREMVSRTASVLAVLLREGEENRRLLASFCADGDATARKVPTEAELRKLLTPRQLVLLRPSAIAAINDSLRQEVEAAPAKNGGGAEPKSGSAQPG